MHKPYQHTKFAEANKQTNERTNCQPTNKQTNKPATDDEGNARPSQAKARLHQHPDPHQHQHHRDVQHQQ